MTVDIFTSRSEPIASVWLEAADMVAQSSKSWDCEPKYDIRDTVKAAFEVLEYAMRSKAASLQEPGGDAIENCGEGER